MKPKKARVKFILDSDVLDWMDGKRVESFIELLQNKIESANKKSLSDLHFELVGYDDLRINLVGWRDETDKEYNKRLKKLQRDKLKNDKEKEKNLKAEFEKYMELKKKFEGSQENT